MVQMGVMKKRKKEPLGELRMDSTADVAFLLLIFFIVTTIFAAEQGLTLVLPGKQKQQEDTVKVKESNIATIFVNRDNYITLDKKAIEINHIKQAIEDRLMANEKLVVVLKMHPEANYGLMVACLDELRLAKANKVSLKTAEK
jgi:biopolymer transport protein ExbD